MTHQYLRELFDSALSFHEDAPSPGHYFLILSLENIEVLVLFMLCLSRRRAKLLQNRMKRNSD